MTLEEINELTIQDVQGILEERLNLKVEEEADLSLFEAELNKYKNELADKEEARLAEIERVEDLKARFKAMSDKGILQGKGIRNPDLYFNKTVLKSSKAEAEAMMVEMEDYYRSVSKEIVDNEWLEGRKREYKQLDHEFLEALAEKEEGKYTKMQEYLAKRAKIKNKYPKPLK